MYYPSYNKVICFFSILMMLSLAIEQTCQSHQECPQNAYCKDNGYCACGANFIGDCSIQALPLSESVTEAPLTAGEIQLFTINPINTDHFLEFTIVICQKGTHLPMTLYFWGDTGKDAAFTSDTTLQQPKKISFPTSCIQLSTSYIEFSQQANGQNDELVLGLMVQRSTSVSVTVSERIVIEIYIFYYIMMAVISFITAFLLVCTIVLIFRRRFGNRLRNNRDRNGMNNIDHFDTMIPACKAGSIEESTCPICLQIIEPTEDIRTTFCEHVYHQQCLDAWCKKNISCPICRSDLNVDSMKLQAQKRKKQTEPVACKQAPTKATNKDKYHRNWQEEDGAEIEVELEENPSQLKKQLVVSMLS